MIEPLSLAPLARARARFLLAAGDPLQLPPVVADPPAPAGGAPGLARPLFVRLAARGAAPALLRRQYRCHPDVAAIANAAFYGGRLLDGVAAADRAALVPGLPPVAAVDVRGEESRGGGGGSRANAAEAEAAAAVVALALAAGVPPARVGVICFYRAQAYAARAAVDRAAPAAAAAGREAARAARAAARAAAGGGAVDPDAAAAAEAAADAKWGGAVAVATVDSFQGQERDVVVLTTAVTRAAAFVAKPTRLNVALTRARHHLVIVGHAPALAASAPALAAALARARASPGGWYVGLPAMRAAAARRTAAAAVAESPAPAAPQEEPAVEAPAAAFEEEEEELEDEAEPPAAAPRVIQLAACSSSSGDDDEA
jgi:superfamily I DNA and/or RNA helicase